MRKPSPAAFAVLAEAVRRVEAHGPLYGASTLESLSLWGADREHYSSAAGARRSIDGLRDRGYLVHTGAVRHSVHLYVPSESAIAALHEHRGRGTR